MKNLFIFLSVLRFGSKSRRLSCRDELSRDVAAAARELRARDAHAAARVIDVSARGARVREKNAPRNKSEFKGPKSYVDQVLSVVLNSPLYSA